MAFCTQWALLALLGSALFLGLVDSLVTLKKPTRGPGR